MLGEERGYSYIIGGWQKDMLLHIVHPMMYLMPTPSYPNEPSRTERNAKVRSFAERFEDDLLVHYMNTDDLSLSFMMQECSLRMTEEFSYLTNGEEIWTAQNGLPYPSTRPEGMEQKDWDYSLQFFSTEEEVLSLTKEIDDHLFIGGVLENCVSQAMGYFRYRVAPQGSIHYVPDLCVSTNANLLEKKMGILAKEYNIYPLTPEEALARLEESKLHEEGDRVSDKTQE